MSLEIKTENESSYKLNSPYDNHLIGGNNHHALENEQNNENLQRERDYAKSKRKKKEITREAIENLIPRNITLVSAAKELNGTIFFPSLYLRPAFVYF